MNIVFIYTLSHPITKEVRYVGKTRNPKERYKNHLNKDHNKRSHKTNWIESLKAQKLKPVFEIIDEVPENEWKFWEQWWIQQMVIWGFNLTNHTIGGDGLTCGNQTSFKKGVIPWNKGTANTFTCPVCFNAFSRPPSNAQVTCSTKCSFKLGRTSSSQFQQGSTAWNRGISGYALTGKKKAIPVLQFDLTDNFIKEFRSCGEAATAMNCIQENIRRCCVGLSKTAMGFKFKYKYEQQIINKSD